MYQDAILMLFFLQYSKIYSSTLKTWPINRTFGEKFFNVLRIFSLNFLVGVNGFKKLLLDFK